MVQTPQFKSVTDKRTKLTEWNIFNLYFQATVCKTPYAIGQCSVCLATLVYCGQTAGWIKMPLDTDVGLCPGDSVLDGDAAGHIELDGDPAPPTVTSTAAPTFQPCLLWPNGWMDQDPVGTEVGLGPSDIVLGANPVPLQRGAHQPPPHFYALRT